MAASPWIDVSVTCDWRTREGGRGRVPHVNFITRFEIEMETALKRGKRERAKKKKQLLSVLVTPLPACLLTGYKLRLYP